MEVGVFLLKLLKYAACIYFFERIIRIVDRELKIKRKLKKIDQERMDKDFWGQ